MVPVLSCGCMGRFHCKTETQALSALISSLAVSWILDVLPGISTVCTFVTSTTDFCTK